MIVAASLRLASIPSRSNLTVRMRRRPCSEPLSFGTRTAHPLQRGDIDPEALALTEDGTLFLASEGVPHRGIDPLVGRFTLDGSLNGTQDLPEHFLPDAGGTRGVRDNLGFEGLAVSPDGSRLFVAAENALTPGWPRCRS